jgi:hypothetical protein
LQVCGSGQNAQRRAAHRQRHQERARYVSLPLLFFFTYLELFFCVCDMRNMYAERCGELQQQADALRQDLEAAHVNNAHLLRVRSILELSEKRLAEAVAQVA